MPFAALLLLVLVSPHGAQSQAPAQGAQPLAPPAAQPQAAPPPPEAVTSTELKGPSPAADAIAAGQAAFKKRHFKIAQADFEKAVAADPQSAAAAFYLGYTFYKIGEPSRRTNPSKERARELFAKAFALDPAFTPDWGRSASAEPAAAPAAPGKPRPKKTS
jgi:tetratricopeptide (TPR) repeat protein